MLWGLMKILAILKAVLHRIIEILCSCTLLAYSPLLTTIGLPLCSRGRETERRMAISIDAAMAYRNVVRSDATYASMTINRQYLPKKIQGRYNWVTLSLHWLVEKSNRVDK